MNDINEGVLLFEQADWPAAARKFNEKLAGGGKLEQPAHYYLAGISFFKSGDFKSAAESLKTFLEQSGGHFYALVYLARCHDRMNDQRAAVNALEEALEINPSAAESWLQLAAWYSRSGRSDEAASAAVRAVQLKPAHEKIQTAFRQLSGKGLNEAAALTIKDHSAPAEYIRRSPRTKTADNAGADKKPRKTKTVTVLTIIFIAMLYGGMLVFLGYKG